MSTRTVLVVEDEEASRSMLQTASQRLGCECVTASDGEEAWTLFQKCRPDLVISDIYLPKLSGVHLLRNIRRCQSKSKVILITGAGHFQQLCADVSSRPDGFFRKPFLIPDLLKRMNELLPEK